MPVMGRPNSGERERKKEKKRKSPFRFSWEVEGKGSSAASGWGEGKSIKKEILSASKGGRRGEGKKGKTAHPDQRRRDASLSLTLQRFEKGENAPHLPDERGGKKG